VSRDIDLVLTSIQKAIINGGKIDVQIMAQISANVNQLGTHLKEEIGKIEVFLALDK
jgi:hypothetical protein